MIELLTTAEMAEADRLAITGGTPGIELMENAGRAVAERAEARHRSKATSRASDGFVAARILAERGHRVRLLLAGSRERLKGDAALAAARWSGPSDAATPEGLLKSGKPDIIIDALFGAGLDRPVEGAARALIAAM